MSVEREGALAYRGAGLAPSVSTKGDHAQHRAEPASEPGWLQRPEEDH
jgi:hypothetical protein